MSKDSFSKASKDYSDRKGTESKAMDKSKYDFITRCQLTYRQEVGQNNTQIDIKA